MHALLPFAAAPAAPFTAGRRAGKAGGRPTTRVSASRFPKRGYFSDADPNEEVYVKSDLGGDLTKRGGRWESDFIWNKDWIKQMERRDRAQQREEEEAKARKEGRIRDGQPAGKGYLSLTSKVDLNSMDVDLSEQLRVRKKSGKEASTSDGRQMGAARSQAGAAPKRKPAVKYGSDPPTRGEERSWARSGRFVSRAAAASPAQPSTAEEQAALAATVAAERKRYAELKAELQAWAAGLTAVCMAATFAFYGREVAASYGVGAVGGLLYLRLLNRSVDAVGAGGASGVGALYQPRLLIPVVLVLGLNRYNALAADDTGLALQLLPMLVGFFTYKGAVVAKQSLELFAQLAAGQQPLEGESEGEAGGEGGAAGSAAGVDRAFRRRMLSEF